MPPKNKPVSDRTDIIRIDFGNGKEGGRNGTYSLQYHKENIAKKLLESLVTYNRGAGAKTRNKPKILRNWRNLFKYEICEEDDKSWLNEYITDLPKDSYTQSIQDFFFERDKPKKKWTSNTGKMKLWIQFDESKKNNVQNQTNKQTITEIMNMLKGIFKGKVTTGELEENSPLKKETSSGRRPSPAKTKRKKKPAPEPAAIKNAPTDTDVPAAVPAKAETPADSPAGNSIGPYDDNYPYDPNWSVSRLDSNSESMVYLDDPSSISSEFNSANRGTERPFDEFGSSTPLDDFSFLRPPGSKIKFTDIQFELREQHLVFANDEDLEYLQTIESFDQIDVLTDINQLLIRSEGEEDRYPLEHEDKKEWLANWNTKLDAWNDQEPLKAEDIEEAFSEKIKKEIVKKGWLWCTETNKKVHAGQKRGEMFYYKMDCTFKYPGEQTQTTTKDGEEKLYHPLSLVHTKNGGIPWCLPIPQETYDDKEVKQYVEQLRRVETGPFGNLVQQYVKLVQQKSQLWKGTEDIEPQDSHERWLHQAYRKEFIVSGGEIGDLCELAEFNVMYKDYFYWRMAAVLHYGGVKIFEPKKVEGKKLKSKDGKEMENVWEYYDSDYPTQFVIKKLEGSQARKMKALFQNQTFRDLVEKHLLPTQVYPNENGNVMIIIQPKGIPYTGKRDAVKWGNYEPNENDSIRVNDTFKAFADKGFFYADIKPENFVAFDKKTYTFLNPADKSLETAIKNTVGEEYLGMVENLQTRFYDPWISATFTKEIQSGIHLIDLDAFVSRENDELDDGTVFCIDQTKVLNKRMLNDYFLYFGKTYAEVTPRYFFQAYLTAMNSEKTLSYLIRELKADTDLKWPFKRQDKAVWLALVRLMVYNALQVDFVGLDVPSSQYPVIKDGVVQQAAKDLATAYGEFEYGVSDSEDDSEEEEDSSSDDEVREGEKEYSYEISKADYVGLGIYKKDLLDITIQVIEDPGHRNLGTVGTAEFVWDPILKKLIYNFRKSKRQKEREQYAIEEDPFIFDKDAVYAAARFYAENNYGFKSGHYKDLDKEYNYVKKTRGNQVAI